MTPKAWLIIGAELLLSLLLIYILLGQISSEKKRADDATSLAKQRQETIDDMTVRQRDVATLDAKYTGELADAKAELEKLRGDVAAGRKRLQVAATCPKNGTASAPGLDDATGPRLTSAAERDYFTLRERIETITKQLTGLQQYVREQCLR
ncbi:lysis protein [Phytobacter ursingii]|uniref:Lysis protein n=1 Tax=Phytobacter ursingii TaxID=1972431 RepID=A0AB35RVU9_9ENTR|nr:lysis protein [Phytobacter ursingii]AUU92120.1 lysis protein [Enterobacteriaceae bacterium ENNIH3]AUV07835.1 lysis protein [Enterobacteriaceae bacterium ENNIH2]MDV2864972.1 lysis protein [Phytobacter ursingii]